MPTDVCFSLFSAGRGDLTRTLLSLLGKISPHELRGGSRRRKASALRAMIAKRGLDELGLSLAEIARHAGVTTSSIARTVARLEKEE